MSGSFQALLASSGGGVPLAPGNINVNSNGSGVTASFRFDTAGTITYASSGGFASGPASWFNPPGGTPGNSYWVRFNVGAGSVTVNQATTFQPLTSNRQCSITVAGVGVGSASGTYQISSDAGGVSIVGSGNWQLSCN